MKLRPLLLLQVLAMTLGLAVCGLAAPVPASASAQTNQNVRVYFGTYTGAKSKGIYSSMLDSNTGALSVPVLAAEATNPSFLALHPGRALLLLYAVNEVDTFDGKPGGAVSAFAIDPQSSRLTLLNQRSSGGGAPCHLTVDRSGRFLLLANYNGGSAAVLPIGDDGRLGEVVSFVQHQGSGPNPQRQQGPHAHGSYLDAPNRFALVPDLGLDRVMIYRFDPARGALTANDPPFVALQPGDGPRHLAFHPGGRFAYVINELHSTIAVFGYAAAGGRMNALQTLSTLPADFRGESSTAEIAVHPSGMFLYGSNRGHDSIAVFALDGATGKLTHVQHQPTLGRTPRHFAIDPTGAFLLAANQGSDTVGVFRIDPASGRLAPAGRSIEVGAPVCVMFVPRG